MARARAWCFTYFPGYEDHYEALLENLECEYLVFGRETCPDTGRLHLQGYVEFKHTKTMSAVKAWMSNNELHLERRSGTAKQASDYCKKGEQSHAEWKESGIDGPNFGKNASFFEKGEISKDPKEGGSMEKDRWERAAQCAREGRFEDIDMELYTRYMSTYKKMRFDALKDVQPRDELDNWWIWGCSGTGKGNWARHHYNTPYGTAYTKDPTQKWWNDYNGEDAVIIEDFDKYQVKQGGDMKRWCDHDPFQAEVKGDYRKIRPKTLIVTSNYPPEGIWNDEETLEPIYRRFKVFRSIRRCIGKDDVPVMGVDLIPWERNPNYSYSFRP